MDFFKSLVLDEDIDNPNESAPDSTTQSESDPEETVSDEEQVSGTTGLWSFGSLIQTITTRSESVLETYRRDLEEFGSGLRKETDLFREAAAKAVKDLPASIDVAHGAIDGMMKSIAGSDEFGGESKTPDTNRSSRSRDSVRYSRFEAQLNAIQNDVKTYREEPEDLEEFRKWKLGFALIDRGEEIANLIGGNGVLEVMHKDIVPSEVDNETFWFRYFYRVHKLQQQESLRANLVKRAISIDDDEELSWDVDDDDDDDADAENDDENEKENVGESSVVKEKGDGLHKNEKVDVLVNTKDSIDQDANGIGEKGDSKDESISVSAADNVGEHKSDEESASKKDAVELKTRDESEVKTEEMSGKLEADSEVKKENSEVKGVEKSEEKESLKGKTADGGLGKESGVSAESSHQSKVEEEDLEWDEIEDVDSNDEKKTASAVRKPDQADLKKRLSTAEEDEDLSWDIEDDD